MKKLTLKAKLKDDPEKKRIILASWELQDETYIRKISASETDITIYFRVENKDNLESFKLILEDEKIKDDVIIRVYTDKDSKYQDLQTISIFFDEDSPIEDIIVNIEEI